MRGKLLAFVFSLLLPILSVFFVANQAQAQEITGSISVCKIIVDQNNIITNGADKPGNTFSISGFTPSPVTSQGDAAGVIPTSTFTTPLTLNSHILANTQGNDSQCFTYPNLPFGSYYYSQEQNTNSGWDVPFYSDQYTGPANTVVNLYSYDANLFDNNQANDDSRNLNADGNIILSADRPTRVLIIANRYHAADNQPTVTPTPTANPSTGSGSSNGGGDNGGSGFTFTCNDTAPSSAPVITNITTNTNSVTLTWTKAGDPVSFYFVEYGTQPGKYIFGNPNIGNTTTYTINGLSGNTTYYFVVGAGNGCKSGPASNEISGTPNGGQINTPPAGFAPIVLGVTAPTPIPSGEVKGAATLTNGLTCANCIWWPLLLAEAVGLIILFGFFRKSVKAVKRKYFFGAVIGVVIYIIFLIINRNCAGGLMNLILLSIPCKFFWALDGGLYALISLVMRKTSVRA